MKKIEIEIETKISNRFMYFFCNCAGKRNGMAIRLVHVRVFCYYIYCTLQTLRLLDWNLIWLWDIEIEARRWLGFSVTLITDRPEIEPAYIGDKCRTRTFLILLIITHYNLACLFPGYCYIFFSFLLSSSLARTNQKRKNISLLRKYI